MANIQNSVYEEEDFHPELNTRFLIYVKYSGNLYNEFKDACVAISVYPEMTLEEIQEKVFEKHNILPELFLLTFKGRRLLDLSLTVDEVNLRADDIIDIQWD